MRITSLLAITLLLLGISTESATAQEAPPRSVTVSATDTVRVSPDRAIVRFAVVTRAQDPDAARRENETASRRALDAVRGLQVPERQIQVQSIRIQEEVEYRQGRRVRIGFIARRDVEVILDDMDLLAGVVGAVVQEGATELGGIQYDIRDRRAQEDEALRKAALRARQKAEVLASTLGATIRGVHAVVESGVRVPQPMPTYARAMAMEMDAGVDEGAYSAGELEVRATLTVVFELE